MIKLQRCVFIQFPKTNFMIQETVVLMQKIAQLALHSLNYIQASFPYHFSLIFDLHTYSLTLFSLKNLKKH